MSKINCWEFKNCGREPEGKRAAELGICPASEDNSAIGINSGIYAGRICWVVAGTFCGGYVEGDSARKMSSCLACDFFLMVKEEESNNFTMITDCHLHNISVAV
ncbi:MAG: hypothetical protein ISR96_08940 [Nitrospira sp.]|nr:hypothetical protein [bacterium]MBL7049625.1 hypothetical protein [Nitrospira sp.]